jgi:hypothetical protein
MKRGFLDLLDLSNDSDFFWQVISGPPCIYDQYIFTKYRKSISDFVKTGYVNCFGRKLCNQDEPWVPHIVCQNCVVCLRQWPRGKKHALKFRTPMIWREPQSHHDQSYFCVINFNGINSGNQNKWSYPKWVSAQ